MANSTETAAIIAALEGMQWDTAAGPITFRKEDHQAICDTVLLGFAPAEGNASPGWKMLDAVRVPGTEVIEPPTPGKAA